jgi:hypothetical protein
MSGVKLPLDTYVCCDDRHASLVTCSPLATLQPAATHVQCIAVHITEMPCIKQPQGQLPCIATQPTREDGNVCVKLNTSRRDFRPVVMLFNDARAFIIH